MWGRSSERSHRRVGEFCFHIVTAVKQDVTFAPVLPLTVGSIYHPPIELFLHTDLVTTICF